MRLRICVTFCSTASLPHVPGRSKMRQRTLRSERLKACGSLPRALVQPIQTTTHYSKRTGFHAHATCCPLGASPRPLSLGCTTLPACRGCGCNRQDRSPSVARRLTRLPVIRTTPRWLSPQKANRGKSPVFPMHSSLTSPGGVRLFGGEASTLFSAAPVTPLGVTPRLHHGPSPPGRPDISDVRFSVPSAVPCDWALHHRTSPA